ncbi:MAG: TrkH family potassium uptake protein [Hyphomicrobiaceae bacterium]
MSRSRIGAKAVQPVAAQGLRPVFYLVGIVLLATAGMMVLPFVVDLSYGNRDWRAFAIAAAISSAAGVPLTYLNRRALKSGLTLRQAFILTPASWVSVATVGALPLFFSEYGSVGGSPANAFFESVSGITTTGATVISGLDDAPPGMLLWRALLQWMGGIGIIASAIAILPALGIGGMQLFRTESSDRSDKALPKLRQIVSAIGVTYLGLTALAALVYWLLGMRPFDAVAHALTSIATGGYSTSDGSFGTWEANGIQWFATAFMLAGSIPFVLYVRFVAGDMRALWDQQVKTFLVLGAVVVVLLGLWLALSGQFDIEPAFRHAAFNVVSILTTTGYATTDYASWGNAVIGLFFVLTFVGGCTGSTAGGIKIFRFEIVAIMLRTHFQKLLYPNGVFPRAYAGRPVDDSVVSSVVAFLAVFFICYVVLTIALMAFGLDFLTSASGAATALANVGPGLGDIIGPTGNFESLPNGTKWLLSAGMLLGRLELFTILVLFVPRFWRG